MAKRVYQQAHAAVRFFGQSFDPLDATVALRLPYDQAWRAGEPHVGRNPRTGIVTEFAPRRTGLWLMSSEAWVDSPRLSVHLEWLLDQLEPRAQAVAGLIDSGADADFFCYSYGSSDKPPSLPRSVRQRADALGIKVVIDHYHD